MKSKMAAFALLGLGAMMSPPAPAATHGGHRPGWDERHVSPSHRPPLAIFRYATPNTVYLSPSEVVPAVPASPAYTDADGRLCREYRLTVTVDDARRPAYGTACQQVDGTWLIVRKEGSW